MLTEYAIIPDILDASSYSVPGASGIHLQNLKEALLREGVVGDLYNGDLIRYIGTNAGRWDPKAKELIKKLATQHRFVLRPSAGSSSPSTDVEWIDESILSHSVHPFDGIITSEINKKHSSDPILSSIEKLSSALWWQSRTSSVRITRDTIHYLKTLSRVLRHSNSIMFIDPHLDPVKHSYREFGQILSAIRNVQPKPYISIHRTGHFGPTSNRISNDEWEASFKKHYGPILTALGNSMEVFIWKDEFHYRYIISDLIGLSIDNGLDLDPSPGQLMQVSRLGKVDWDDVQREFDPVSYRHKLMHRFSIP
jgi:hypothetical protein